jgi:TRAP-type C4-dicarboxylate transport system permease small subunit
MNLFFEKLKRILEWLNACVLFLMFAIIILQISARTIFLVSVSWTDDLARATYRTMVFLGASLAIRDSGAHISVDIFVQFLSKRGKTIFRIIAALVIIPFFVTFIIGAFENVVTYWGSIVPTIGWLGWGHLYAVIAVSGCLMFIYNLLNLSDDIRSLVKAEH